MISNRDRDVALRILSAIPFEEDHHTIIVEFALQAGHFLEASTIDTLATTQRFPNSSGKDLISTLLEYDADSAPPPQLNDPMLWRFAGELHKLRPPHPNGDSSK